MSLDVTLTAVQKVEVFGEKITHNLNVMAGEAGIYEYLWRPKAVYVNTAKDLIEPLKAGLKRMKNNPEHYKKFNASNGWGTYENFIPWIEKYIEACEKNPDAEVSVYR